MMRYIHGVLAGLAFVPAAACAQSSAAAPARATATATATAATVVNPARVPDWLQVDAASKTARLTLEVTHAAGDSIVTINGERQGSVQIVVPLNWTVQWSWVNGDSSGSHSLVVMAEREKLPLEGGRPALDNAWSRAVNTGLKPGQKDNTTFIADQAGWYWMLCGVPGHAIAGEWIGLKVDRDATTASIVRKSS